MDSRKLACLLGVAVTLVACGKTEPKSEASPSGGQIAAALPSTTSAAAPADLGIAIYPGAQTLMASHLLGSDKGSAIYDSAFKVTDKLEKVAGFYRDELSKLSDDKTKPVDLPVGEGFVHLMGGKDQSKVFDITMHAEGADVLFNIKTLINMK